jgi:hypothetical protein
MILLHILTQWEHKAHTTHDKDKHNTTQKTKEMNNLNPTTNQRQWEHKAHTTHDKDKHNTTQKTKEMNNLNPTTNQRPPFTKTDILS